MLRYLFYLEPKDNQLYESARVARFLRRRSLLVLRLSQVALLIALVFILSAFWPTNGIPQLLYQGVEHTSLRMLPLIALMAVSLSVATTTLTFSLRQQVGELVALSSVQSQTYIEALWATIVDTFPYRWVMLAFAVGALLLWLPAQESLRLEASYGLRQHTWMLVLYPLILMTQVWFLTSAVLFISIWVSHRYKSLPSALSVSVMLTTAALAALASIKWAAQFLLQRQTTFPLGGATASVRASTAFIADVELVRNIIYGDVLGLAVLIITALAYLHISLTARVHLQAR